MGRKLTVYISNKEIEEISEALVKEVHTEYKVRHVDIDAIASYLGLKIRYEQFAESDPDKIGFTADGIAALNVIRNKVKIAVVFPKNTIILDRFLRRKNEARRRRFTLAHEISHVLLNHADPLKSAACFNRLYDNERTYTISELRKRMTLDECQANAMAAMLLMPRSLLSDLIRKRFRRRTIPVYGDNVLLPQTKLLLKRISDQLGVSHTTLLIQLRTYGMIEPHDISEYFEITYGDAHERS